MEGQNPVSPKAAEPFPEVEAGRDGQHLKGSIALGEATDLYGNISDAQGNYILPLSH